MLHSFYNFRLLNTMQNLVSLTVSHVCTPIRITVYIRFLFFFFLQEKLHQTNLSESFSIIESCIQAATNEKTLKRLRTEVKKEREAESEIQTSPEFVTPAVKLSKEALLKWAEQKNARFNHVSIPYLKDTEDLETKVIDALLQLDVLTLIKEKLCNKT